MANAAVASLNVAWCQLEMKKYVEALRMFGRLKEDLADSSADMLALLVYAGEGLTLNALADYSRAEQAAAICVERIEEANVTAEIRAVALHAVGQIRGEVELLEQSAACWRQLERPAWLARTLDVLIDLGVNDPGLVTERDEARATLAAARAQMEDGVV